ncbi:MAG: GDP-mannose 4,6-dehydratase [Pseudomonadota bacterium]
MSESPLRSKNFVTAKIVSQACQIARGELKTIELGNLEVRRDWGCASEFMYAVMLCLKQQTPSDYLIATGNTSSLGDFLEFTFAALNLDYRDYLVSQERLFRPLDIKQTLCDVSQTSDYLGWSAKKSLQDVVNGMVKAEMNLHRPRLTPVQQLAN